MHYRQSPEEPFSEAKINQEMMAEDVQIKDMPVNFILEEQRSWLSLYEYLSSLYHNRVAIRIVLQFVVS